MNTMNKELAMHTGYIAVETNSKGGIFSKFIHNVTLNFYLLNLKPD